MKITRILFPTDFSETAKKALKQALILTAKYDAELTVLHARILHDDDPALLPAALQKIKTEQADMEAHIHQYIRDCTQAYPHLNIKHEIIRGYSAPSAVLSYVNNHPFDLVVIGAHGRSGLEHFLIGSVAEKVVRYASCPVLTVSRRAKISDRFAKIVVPFDFSAHAKLALQTAFKMTDIQAEVVLVYVIDQGVQAALSSLGMKSVVDMVPDIRAKVEQKMDEVLAGLSNPRQAKVSTKIIQGVPHKELARFINNGDCDLVVIATHGLVGLDRFLLGSTIERIIRSVHKPILALKQKNLI